MVVGGGCSQTLSLLAPKEDMSSECRSPNPTSSSGSSCGQLTMFYAGTVNVYDNVSEDKARAIMLLAGNGSAGSVKDLLRSLCGSRPSLAEPPQKMQKLLEGSFLRLNSQQPPPSCRPVPSAVLPQARKASLTRFLQRRRERLLQKQSTAVEDNSSLSEPGPCHT